MKANWAIDLVVIMAATAISVCAFCVLYPMLTPLRENPESIIGAEPAAWSAFFVEIALLAIGWAARKARSIAFSTALSFAVSCVLLAAAEGSCKTGMLLFAAFSMPTVGSFWRAIDEILLVRGNIWTITLAIALPMAIIGIFLFGQ
jgi:hypothetical protein